MNILKKKKKKKKRMTSLQKRFMVVLNSIGLWRYKPVELSQLFFRKLINVTKKVKKELKMLKKSKVAENFKSCRNVAEQLVAKPSREPVKRVTCKDFLAKSRTTLYFLQQRYAACNWVVKRATSLI